MSWQGYVDQQLVASGHVSKGAIIGLDGSQWAISPGFNLDPSEAAAIAAAARNPSSVLGGGINLQGVKFMVLRADDTAIYVRKGSDGACIVKTNQCVLIGLYGENIQAGQCNMVVEKLGDYLRENNY
eukprot:CAMPEP_0174915374 /NCGR_PEP_ID=MMETSP1355-20121228/987_1 /TAXON_ID=464990 /ORGANISM="Hemiselmis tepida, Strain CCMP443" /LENGTH=126 /DNA_ID=CAMNT_0016160247 /DNA_START=16 /DNA_END=396 /DNA_ORIENTATION=+